MASKNEERVREELVKELSRCVSGLAHGIGTYDVVRALVSVISCGICTDSLNRNMPPDDFIEVTVHLLRKQVEIDLPLIQRDMMMGKKPDPQFLPQQRM